MMILSILEIVYFLSLKRVKVTSFLLIFLPLGRRAAEDVNTILSNTRVPIIDEVSKVVGLKILTSPTQLLRASVQSVSSKIELFSMSVD